MDSERSERDRLHGENDDTDFELFNSLDATQGSLPFHADSQLDSMDKNSQASNAPRTLLTQVPLEPPSEKIIRLSQKPDDRQTLRWQMQPIGSYDSLSNMIYFGNMSLEEKHFTLPQSSQEIRSAADLREADREEVYPSFQDLDIPELLCDDGRAEREKFHEILAQRQALSAAEGAKKRPAENPINVSYYKSTASSKNPTNIPYCRSGVSGSSGDTELNPATPSHDSPRPSPSHHNFTLITEAELASTGEQNSSPYCNYFGTIRNDFYDQLVTSSYDRDEPDAAPLQCSIPNSSLTNLEHPSYQLRFRQDSKPDMFQNWNEYDGFPARFASPDYELAKKPIRSSVATISQHSKPIVIKCKEKSTELRKNCEPKSSSCKLGMTRNSNKEFSISRCSSDSRHQIYCSSNRNSANKVNLSKGSVSCPSLEKMEQETSYFNAKSRPNMLYNQEISSLSSKTGNQRTIISKKCSFYVEERKVISLDELTSGKEHKVAELGERNLLKCFNNGQEISQAEESRGRMYPSSDSSSGNEETSDVISYGNETYTEKVNGLRDAKQSTLFINTRSHPPRNIEPANMEFIPKYQNYTHSNSNSSITLFETSGNVLTSPSHFIGREVVREKHKSITSQDNESLSSENGLNPPQIFLSNDKDSNHPDLSLSSEKCPNHPEFFSSSEKSPNPPELVLDHTIIITKLNDDADLNADDQGVMGVISASCADRLFYLTQKRDVVSDASHRQGGPKQGKLEQELNRSSISHPPFEKQLLESSSGFQDEQKTLLDHGVMWSKFEVFSTQSSGKPGEDEGCMKPGAVSNMYSGLEEGSSSEDSSDSEGGNLEVFHRVAAAPGTTSIFSHQFGSKTRKNMLKSAGSGERNPLNDRDEDDKEMKCASETPDEMAWAFRRRHDATQSERCSENNMSLAGESDPPSETFARKTVKSSDTYKVKSGFDDGFKVDPTFASANNAVNSSSGDRSSGGSPRSPGLPLTSQPVADPTLRNKTLRSRGELQESQFSSQDPIRPHRTDPSSRPHRTDPGNRPYRTDSSGRPQSDLRTPDPTMLATEQPLGLRPAPHHYGSSDEQESLELESRAEKYLFQGRYSPTDSSHDQQSRSYEPLDRRFPNGFPDFNHKFKNNSNNYFRNNISRDAEFERKVDNYCFDAGYSSEKSPEEDQAPSGFDIETLSSREQTASPCHGDYTDGQTDDRTEEEQQQSLVLQMIDNGQELSTSALMEAFGFINEGSLFDVTLEKNSRGLGLALTGGRETQARHAGLIRIKKLYPQMPAWLCGQLRLGDILLEANGVPLSGLSSHEALEELRTTRTSSVHLVLCRPPAGTFEDDHSASPVPAAAGGCPEVVSSSMMGHQLCPSDQLQVPSPLSVCGEFEVTLAKVKGSLGFTLRKRDNSVLGHTIRTLVRDPALSDGRIKPGDKILSVNNRDLCGLSHEEAIAFLRTTPDVVTIRLYRDVTQTPVSPLSPTEPEHSILNPKPLRQEARDMLSDLALRKRSSPTSNSPGLDGTHSPSPGNPRRRRLHKTPTPDVAKPNNLVDKFDLLVQGIEEDPFNMAESPSGLGNPDNASLTNRDSCTSTLSANSTVVSRNASTASTGTNSLSEASETRRRRPNFLDLDSRQSCSRKVQFTPPHEIGDSFPSPNDEEENNYLESIGSVDSAPACSNAQSVSPAFTHSQPGYQSVHFGGTHDHARLTGTSSDFTLSSHLQQDSDVGRQKTGLMKWKGTYMGQESDCEDGGELKKDFDNASSGYGKSLRKKEVTITLHRGWNSRLGFSLKAVDGVTRVVAVYAGCVAAKDGRLKVGDEIISVNGDDVSEWRTEDVIDLLRKTHGNIELRVVQPAF